MRISYLLVILGIILAAFSIAHWAKPLGGAPPSPLQPIIDACIRACKDAVAAGRELEQGPCLLDPLPQHPDWVCDVAHDPRKPIDDLPENQCQAYRRGAARHFVEVTPDCSIIRTV